MRRLTLILSDLYLPEDSRSVATPTTPVLPALSAVLSRAKSTRIRDWRHWLLEECGIPHASQTLAALCAPPDIPGPVRASAWLATPVHLEARLDHVRLVDRGLLALESDEQRECCAGFGRAFGPDYRLQELGENAFLLLGESVSEARTVDPARLLGADIGPAVPGAEAPTLRRLGSEIEMWLHGLALNDRRQRAGKPRISALWLWGNQVMPGRDASRASAASRFQGRDPLLRSLDARAADWAWRAFADLPSGETEVYLELLPMSGDSAETLAAADLHWFAPAKVALEQGQLDQLRLVANDRLFTLARRDLWKFWRGRRGWLESLA